MKYIRTKDGIYDTEDLYICEQLVGKPYGVKNSGWLIYKESIVKQADTIEELCDEFVLVHTEDDESSKDIFVNENGWFSHRGDHYYDFSLELVKKGKREIFGTLYGAIWTDKGLIYVAKMNEKGELELL